MTRRDAIKQTALVLGYAVSASAAAGVMAGCEAPAGESWMPSFVSPEEGEMLAVIAECIVPRTGEGKNAIPGARDVNVHRFIDVMMKSYIKQKDVSNFMEGLGQVNEKSQSAHQKNFLELSGEEQNALLTSIAEAEMEEMKKRKQAEEEMPGAEIGATEGDVKGFFQQMKELTLLGYFSSEKVGKEVLNFDPVPTAYDGCIDISTVGNVNWAI